MSCVDERCATSAPLDSALDTGPRRVDGDGFDAEFGMELPYSVELRAVDDEGVLIATETFVLAWERPDGGGSCPGSVETDPIEFDPG